MIGTPAAGQHLSLGRQVGAQQLVDLLSGRPALEPCDDPPADDEHERGELPDPEAPHDVETPVVSRSVIDDPARKAALFQFEVPADRFEPGLYTCQVNIIDEVAGTFTFPRLDLYVR